MPKVRETLDVVHHRSQLLIARGNIVRTAIADDSVIDVVQFSPREISIIGIGLGSTTLTIWFDDNPNPLIYLVKTIRDPDIDEQLRIDYGKLERKLADLFPNSKVYLIPLSGKIVVKGQARDAREAARILQIVRNEVINQNGSLFGPQPAGAVAVTAAGPAGLARTAFPGPNPYPGSQSGTYGANGRGAAAYGAFDLASSYVVNMLEIPGEFQVMLRVRIAELNRSQLQRMGIDFSYLFNNGRHAVSYALGGIPSTITGIFENGEISVLIDWLASNGTAKILSEPVITVLSGHTASMLSGGEFAVPTIVGIGGAQGQQTTFRGFGTSLFVTPTVTDKDLIRMTIVPEFSSVNQANSVNGIPGVDARRVQTTIELREGQTIAIAGLIAHQMNTEVTRIPWLADLPYIGPRLFAAKRSTMEETELLILVTPQLVRPMDADEVPPSPGWYVTPPAERPLYHQGMTEGPPDLETYQLAPYGRGAGMGEPVGYRLHNPSPATPGYPPAVTDPYGASRFGARGGIPEWNGQPGPQPPPHSPPGGQTIPRRYVPNQTVPPPQYSHPPGRGFPNPGAASGQFNPGAQPVPNFDTLPGSGLSDPPPVQPERRSLRNLFGLGR